MHPNGKRVFVNKMIVAEMINLRRIGISASSLAIFYGCDRKAIEKQCAKYGVNSELPFVFNVEMIAAEIIKNQPFVALESQWRTEGGERINIGKNYRDYIK